MVVEAVAEPLARKITEAIAIPDDRHRREPACDGQVLVLEDMLGLSPRAPKFVRRYGDLGPAIRQRSRPMPTTSARARSRGRSMSTE